MDLQTAIVTEEHQTEKQKSLMTSDMWNQKNIYIYKWAYSQNRKTLMDLENEHIIASGEDEGKGQSKSLGYSCIYCYI